MFLVGLQPECIPETGHGDHFGRAAAGGPCVFQGRVSPVEIMHRDQDPGFDAEDKIVGTRLKHDALARIHGEKGHVDRFLSDRLDGLAEFRFGLLYFLHGGFLAPVPEIQVSRVKEACSAEVGQETDAQVRRIESGYGHLVGKLQRVAGSHPFSARPHGHVRGNDVGHVGAAAPAEDDGIQMVNVFVADENKDVFEPLKFFGRDLEAGGKFPALPAPVIENKQRMIVRNGKTAVIIMGDDIVLFHADAHLHGYGE